MVHILIENRSFQLDLRHLQRLELQQQDGYQPSSLLLYFESVLFRIFALNRVDTDMYYDLQSAQHRLNTLLGSSSIQQLPYFDLLGSPNGSSQRSSSEAQDTVKDDNNKRSATDDSQTSKIRRRRLNYEQCQTSVAALESVLDMPVSHFKDESVLDRIGPLVTNTADDLAASYCRSTDLNLNMKTFEDDMMEHRPKLEQAMNHFFPAMRSKPKLRTKTASVPETVAAVSEIVEAQKKAIQDRHQLFLLPSRG